MVLPLNWGATDDAPLSSASGGQSRRPNRVRVDRWLGIAATVLVCACAPDRLTHRGWPQPQRELAWQILEDIEQLKQRLPCLAGLNLNSAVTESFNPPRLLLSYEHGRIEISNPRWVPGESTRKTTRSYRRDGVAFVLTLSVDPHGDRHGPNTHRIGGLRIALTSDGPHAHRIKFAVRQILDKHRARMANSDSL